MVKLPRLKSWRKSGWIQSRELSLHIQCIPMKGRTGNQKRGLLFNFLKPFQLWLNFWSPNRVTANIVEPKVPRLPNLLLVGFTWYFCLPAHFSKFWRYNAFIVLQLIHGHTYGYIWLLFLLIGFWHVLFLLLFSRCKIKHHFGHYCLS